jgi:hypothetical protein
MRLGSALVVAVLAVGASAALLAQARDTPLSGLRIDAKKVGWDGIDLGMSLVQAERLTGATLALTKARDRPCGAWIVAVERGTLRLTLGFPSARPGAKIESIYVHFEGYQLLAKRDQLVAELKRLAPAVTYFAPASRPDVAEADAFDPAYALPGDTGYAARIVPEDGLMLTRRECIT